MNNEAPYPPTNPTAENQPAEDHGLLNDLAQTLQGVITKPPLRDHELELSQFNENQPKRPKRKSKYTREQDEIMLDLKKKGGFTWEEIAKEAGIRNFLAARNRYQVLMGQQGVATTVWSAEDILSLQKMVDEGELEKWRFISRKLYELTNKFFTDIQCRDLVRELFFESPEAFNIDEEAIREIISGQQSGEGSSTPN